MHTRFHVTQRNCLSAEIEISRSENNTIVLVISLKFQTGASGQAVYFKGPPHEPNAAQSDARDRSVLRHLLIVLPTVVPATTERQSGKRSAISYITF